MLLAVVTQAAATTWIGVLAVFAAYATGSALLLITLALLAAATSTALARTMRRIAPYAGRIAGALLALSGGYLVYYWLPPLLGADRPSDGGVAALSAQVATWIRTNLAAVALTATALAVIAGAAVLLHRRPSPDTLHRDCRPPTPAAGRDSGRSPHRSVDRWPLTTPADVTARPRRSQLVRASAGLGAGRARGASTGRTVEERQQGAFEIRRDELAGAPVEIGTPLLALVTGRPKMQLGLVADELAKPSSNYCTTRPSPSAERRGARRAAARHRRSRGARTSSGCRPPGETARQARQLSLRAFPSRR